MGKLILALLAMQSAAPASIRDIVTRLRHVKMPPSGTTIVSSEVAADLTALKHALRDLISQAVGASTDVPPEELQARVTAQLEREDVPVGDEEGDEGGYGVITAIKLARPKGYPEWLVASVSLAIPYGDDTSLYVFRTRNGTWQLAMMVEADGYTEISGAQGWREYRVGRLLDGLTPFLVTTDHNPWPTSNRQSLRLQVMQVGPSPEHPLHRLARSFSYFIDQPPEVSIRSGGFALIYLGDATDPKLGGDVGLHYIEYSVTPDAVVLVSQAGADPNNLIDRWAKADLTTASPDLAEWHHRFREPGWGCLVVGYVQTTVRIEDGREKLVAATGCNRGPNTPAAFLVMNATSQGFKIASVSSTRPEWFELYSPPPCTPAPPGETHPVAEQTVEPKLPDGFNSGTVRLRVSVDTDGAVSEVQVLDWPDRPGLVVPAIRAVRQWKFKPGTRDSCIVGDQQTVDVVFTK